VTPDITKGVTLPLMPPRLTDLRPQSEAALMRDIERYLPHDIEKELMDLPMQFVNRVPTVRDDISSSSSSSSSSSEERAPKRPRPMRGSLTLEYVDS